MDTIAFRADASVQIGTGHLRRCIALAYAAREAGLHPLFVCHPLDGTAAPLLAAGGFEVVWLPLDAVAQDADAQATANRLHGRTLAWMLVDHYGLAATWHAQVRASLHCRIAALDDLADRPLAVDLLVDANDPDAAATYATRLTSTAKVLAGPAFAPLDPAYAYGSRHAFHDTVRSIGIFMGGTDPTGACLPALAACDQAGFEGPVELVCSEAAPRYHELAAACLRRPRTVLHTSLPRLDAFYARHDLLLGAGGSTAWERCCTGTPTIACVVAANQYATLPRLERLGAVWWARDTGAGLQAGIAHAIATLRADPLRRRVLSEIARRLVDGEGSRRVIAVLTAIAGAALCVRPAGTQDEATTLRRANDPTVRAHSFHTEAITPDQHSRWFETHLANPQRRLLMVEAPNGMPLGQVRLESKGACWEIGYLLEPEFRGLGLGATILRAAFAAAPDARPLVAHVQPANEPSLRIFRRLGFDEQRMTDHRGLHHCFHARMLHEHR